MSQRNGVAYRYPMKMVDYKVHRRHRLIAEQVLGRPLPSGAEVHHVNENENDFRHSNLVICQDRVYHKLLHTRTRALRACGHADWRGCAYCGHYGPPSEVVRYGQRNVWQHKQCAAEYLRNWRQRRRERIA